MLKSARVLRTMFLTALAALAAGNGAAATIVFGSFTASLDTGALAGITFPVSYSYDVEQVLPVNDSFITLNSFNFTLLGTAFTRNDINQGGQVIFRNGVLNNITASFQGTLPVGSPVNNITFGFGGPGIIGYIDRAGNYASGSFALGAAPEPGSRVLSLVGIGVLVLARKRLAHGRRRIRGSIAR